MEQNLLENQIVTQLVKKFPALYAIQSYITVFTRGHHWSLMTTTYHWSHKSSPQIPSLFLYDHSGIILPPTPRSFKWPLPFRSSHQNYIYFLSPACVLHGLPISSSL